MITSKLISSGESIDGSKKGLVSLSTDIALKSVYMMCYSVRLKLCVVTYLMKLESVMLKNNLDFER